MAVFTQQDQDQEYFTIVLTSAPPFFSFYLLFNQFFNRQLSWSLQSKTHFRFERKLLIFPCILESLEVQHLFANIHLMKQLNIV